MVKILFVCHGNICRSPMAEFVMKDMVKKTGTESQFHIESAATSREEIGNPVYPPAQRKLAEQGISCAGHAAGTPRISRRPGRMCWRGVKDFWKSYQRNEVKQDGADEIQLFEDKRIRTAWDEEKKEWHFSVIDVVAVLTDQTDYQVARNYWKVTKKRLKDEGNETVTLCNQLKMTASGGKKRLTDMEKMRNPQKSINSEFSVKYILSAAEISSQRYSESPRFSSIVFHQGGSCWLPVM